MILKTVLRTIEHYKLISPNQTLIVGVSGGTDSLALLHILWQLQSQLGVKLHVATLDHGIRHDAKADVQFVKAVAERWNIPYTVGYADVPQIAKRSRLGIEAAARVARYEFLADVVRKEDTNWVAVGTSCR